MHSSRKYPYHRWRDWKFQRGGGQRPKKIQRGVEQGFGGNICFFPDRFPNSHGNAYFQLFAFASRAGNGKLIARNEYVKNGLKAWFLLPHEQAVGERSPCWWKQTSKSCKWLLRESLLKLDNRKFSDYCYSMIRHRKNISILKASNTLVR